MEQCYLELWLNIYFQQILKLHSKCCLLLALKPVQFLTKEENTSICEILVDCHGVSIELRFLSQFKGDLHVRSTQEIVTQVVRLQVAELKTSMQSILEQWRVYDEAYAEVSLMTTRYLYCIDQCKRSVVSQEALENQVKTLQVNLLKLSYFCTSFCAFKQTNSTEKKNTEKFI